MDEIFQRDKIRGALFAGAVGDALGYPVEFYSYREILSKYGEKGITRLDFSRSGKALISDDTQMTLFTACGLLNAKEQGRAPVPSIQDAYVEWYYTQIGMRSQRFNSCWIGRLPELNAQRAPGNTCMEALAAIVGSREPSNDSKGCGGIMRIAPIPLYGASRNRIADVKALSLLAADVSLLTHKHPLGYIPAAWSAYVLYRLVSEEFPTREDVITFVRDGRRLMDDLFPMHRDMVGFQAELLEKAVRLSENGLPDVRNIEDGIGEGWVAEETFAIAIYCSLAHFGDLEGALVASVNHNGDSDSTGAVTGNIVGAVCGYDAIPECYKADLECGDVILHVADDLYWGKTTSFVRFNQ